MPREQEQNRNNTAHRVAWFVLLWLAGVGAVGLVAYAIRSAVGL